MLYSGDNGGILPPLEPMSVATQPGWIAKHKKPWGYSSAAKSFKDMLFAAFDIL